MNRILSIRDSSFAARAMVVGERIDLRALGVEGTLAANPLTVAVEGVGAATLFRYGVVVFFAVPAERQTAFLLRLQPLIANPQTAPEVEELELRIEPSTREVVAGGVAFLEDTAVERLQVIADVLAKSAVLSQYERKVAGEFDRVEQIAAELERSGRIVGKSKEFVRKIGTLMLVEQRMVGRAEVTEKPEILWDHPELEGLFARLEDEFELRERHAAVERKLDLISQTSHTLLELLSSRHSLRVEWYIVILILVEIMLTLYEMFVR